VATGKVDFRGFAAAPCGKPVAYRFNLFIIPLSAVAVLYARLPSALQSISRFAAS